MCPKLTHLWKYGHFVFQISPVDQPTMYSVNFSCSGRLQRTDKIKRFQQFEKMGEAKLKNILKHVSSSLFSILNKLLVYVSVEGNGE